MVDTAYTLREVKTCVDLSCQEFSTIKTPTPDSTDKLITDPPINGKVTTSTSKEVTDQRMSQSITQLASKSGSSPV